jgi:hypothetical protein
VSARAAYLRAATYYAVALSSVDGTKDPDTLLRPTFAEHRRCFDADAELLNPPAERVDIPYEGATMPGYLFRPSTSDEQRRTLIMNNGSDGPVTSIWPPVSAGGVALGYNVLVFDGPGQQSMLFEKGVPFRHDWEHVITPWWTSCSPAPTSTRLGSCYTASAKPATGCPGHWRSSTASPQRSPILV